MSQTSYSFENLVLHHQSQKKLQSTYQGLSNSFASNYSFLFKYLFRKFFPIPLQVSQHRVITKLLKIDLKCVIHCFLSINLQRTLKALGGISGV